MLLAFEFHNEQRSDPFQLQQVKNNKRIHALCESLGWFGRGKQNFRLFEQVSMPKPKIQNCSNFESCQC
jgi:hypothetical protein